jgi:RNA polymerase sigma factor (sigma-70 family)
MVDGIDILSKSAIALAIVTPASESPFFGGTAFTDPEREFNKKQTSEKLRAAIATLPEKERTIIEQYYFHDLTLSEVAQQYAGLSKSWVSRLHDRALGMLREKLVEEGIGAKGTTSRKGRTHRAPRTRPGSPRRVPRADRS